MLQIFRQLVVLLGSDSNVVHTYAAVAVERLLAQRVSSSVPFNPFWLRVEGLSVAILPNKSAG